MRHRFLLVFLLLNLSACTFQVEMLTPLVEPPSLNPFPTQTFTLTPYIAITPTSFTVSELPTVSQTSTPPPIPTFTATALPPSEGIYPIHFVANGTFIDIVDSVPSATSRTYSINATKGQVMSVSIQQSSYGEWTYIPIKVFGADGTTFCPLPLNIDCTFWRGILPASQDYFVTITPVADALNFTMRVAINPPGVATQSFQYLAKSGNVSFDATDEFAPVRFNEIPVSKVESEIALQYIDTQAYSKTNLLEADFLFGYTAQNDIVQTCTQPASLGGPESVVGSININGVDFTHSEATGLAAGNIYEQIYHRAVLGGVCYEVIFFIHSTNISVYAPDAGVKEFDRAVLLQRFEDILSTLVIQ
jgi:hypothetical protein